MSESAANSRLAGSSAVMAGSVAVQRLVVFHSLATLAIPHHSVALLLLTMRPACRRHLAGCRQ